jgi:hypothetical protein
MEIIKLMNQSLDVESGRLMINMAQGAGCKVQGDTSVRE